MKFVDFINEKTMLDANKLEQIVKQIDVPKLLDKVKKAAGNINIEVFKSHIYPYAEDTDKLYGYIVYTLNGPNEKYKSDEFEESEDDYFYIGEFTYDYVKEKILDIKESTTDRFATPVDATEKIQKEYKALEI